MAWRKGRVLGQDLRERVLADAGRPARAVAARFGVSVSYVIKARQRLRGAGEASARPRFTRSGGGVGLSGVGGVPRP